MNRRGFLAGLAAALGARAFPKLFPEPLPKLGTKTTDVNMTDDVRADALRYVAYQLPEDGGVAFRADSDFLPQPSGPTYVQSALGEDVDWAEYDRETRRLFRASLKRRSPIMDLFEVDS